MFYYKKYFERDRRVREAKENTRLLEAAQQPVLSKESGLKQITKKEVAVDAVKSIASTGITSGLAWGMKRYVIMQTCDMSTIKVCVSRVNTGAIYMGLALGGAEGLFIIYTDYPEANKAKADIHQRVRHFFYDVRQTLQIQGVQMDTVVFIIDEFINQHEDRQLSEGMFYGVIVPLTSAVALFANPRLRYWLREKVFKAPPLRGPGEPRGRWAKFLDIVSGGLTGVLIGNGFTGATLAFISTLLYLTGIDNQFIYDENAQGPFHKNGVIIQYVMAGLFALFEMISNYHYAPIDYEGKPDASWIKVAWDWFSNYANALYFIFLTANGALNQEKNSDKYWQLGLMMGLTIFSCILRPLVYKIKNDFLIEVEESEAIPIPDYGALEKVEKPNDNDDDQDDPNQLVAPKTIKIIVDKNPSIQNSDDQVSNVNKESTIKNSKDEVAESGFKKDEKTISAKDFPSAIYVNNNLKKLQQEKSLETVEEQTDPVINTVFSVTTTTPSNIRV